MNILEYIDKHKDESFLEYKFTDVDNLILSSLSYVPFSGIVPSFYENGITLNDAVDKYFLKYTSKDIKKSWYLIPKVSSMISKMKNTKRYGNAILYNYINIIDNDKQFCALTIKLNDDSIFVSYEGTDDTMVGWREDFEMAFNYPISSQILAKKYINKTIKLFDRIVRIGGHSKGGNLAMVAGMNANVIIRNKIVNIYNNDGPGFLKEQVESKKYLKILPKVKMFVPRGTIVGMILYHQNNYYVLKSKAVGFLQHDPFSWQCDDNIFIEDIRSEKSKNIEINLTRKLEELSIMQRQELVESIFKIFEENDIKGTKEIKLNKMISLAKSIKNMDKDTKKLLIDLIRIVFI